MTLYIDLGAVDETTTRAKAIVSYVPGLSFEVRSSGRVCAKLEESLAQQLRTQLANGFRAVPQKTIDWLRETMEHPQYPWTREAFEMYGDKIREAAGPMPDFGDQSEAKFV